MNIETRMAWVAGVLEGEAYFGLANKNKTTPIIQLEMTDKDIVEKICPLFRNTIGSRKRKDNWSEIYRIQVCGLRAAAIMMTVYSFMGKRRQDDIKYILEAWRKAQSYIKESDIAEGEWNQVDPEKGPINKEKLINDIMASTQCNREVAIKMLT